MNHMKHNHVSSYLSKRNQRRLSTIQPESKIWLVSFTDIIALMLTFFVLIFSMINPEREIMAQVMNVFNKSQKIGDLDQSGRFASTDQQRLEIQNATDLSYLSSILNERFQTEEIFSGVVLDNKHDLIRITLPQDLLFSPGDFQVNAAVSEKLVDIFSLLKGLKNKIDIQGYTDPSPVTRPRDEYTSNWGLAQQRAASVARLLYDSGYRRHISLFGALGQDQNLNINTELRRVEVLIYAHRNR